MGFGVRIMGSGFYVPERVVDNSYFVDKNPLFEYDSEGGRVQSIETSDEWIQKNMGPVTRRWAKGDETVSDMAYVAVERALKRADIAASSLDGILVASVTQEEQFPSVASILDSRLGSSNKRRCEDVGAACAGLMIALENAYDAIRSRGGIYAVIGAEKLSRIIDETDKNSPLFGDGAGAFIFGPTEDHKAGIVTTYNITRSGEGRNRWIFRDRKGYLRMPNGPDVFKEASRELKIASEELMHCAKWEKEEVDMFLFHQANIRISGNLQRSMGLRDDQTFTNIRELGNTSSASIPIAYTQCVEQGKIRPGSKVIAVSIGSGMTISGAAMVA